MPEPRFLYARPQWITATFCGDGQLFTELIARWMREYLATFGILDQHFSINIASFIKDGGVDGLIDHPDFVDPMGLLSNRCAMQFKAGDITADKAAAELTKVPKDKRARISDFINDGFRVVWFVARTMTDRDIQELEEALNSAVKKLNAQAPSPSVIDANRICWFLSKVPSVALQLQGLRGVGNSLFRVLESEEHRIPFVPPAGFEQFAESISQFAQGSIPSQTYQGDPGIGKTRRVLEVLMSLDQCRRSTLYLRSQRDLEQVVNLCLEQGLRGLIVVDDYVDDDPLSPRLRSDEIPEGCKIIFIRHPFLTERRRGMGGYLDIPRLSEDDIDRVLSFYEGKGLAEPIRRQAAALARHNIRLAKWICEKIDPTIGALTQDHLGDLVNRQLDDLQDGREVVTRLALVPMLSRTRLQAFSALVGIPEDEFLRRCEQVSQQSAFIQFNDVLMYVSIPLIKHTALIRFCTNERIECLRIFEDPGEFAEDLLASVEALPAGTVKEELLRFFELPSGALTLERLSVSDGYGKRFLKLTTAKPDQYLKRLHKLFLAKQGELAEFPYETYGGGIGRRDVIWTIRGLAQFEEFFLWAEEIVYLMARSEIPTPYSNTATSYWASWFHAWFAFTEFPYGKRLDLLEARISTGDARDRELATIALADPFPQTGSEIPHGRIGGRIAPAKVKQIIAADIRTAVERIPVLFERLLSFDDAVGQAGKAWAERMFDWLDITNSPDAFLKVVLNPHFPIASLREVRNSAREYVTIAKGDEGSVKMHDLHAAVLAAVATAEDVVADAELVLGRGAWMVDDSDDLKKIEADLVHRVATDDGVFESVRPILYKPESYGAAQFGEKLAEFIGEEQFWNELRTSFGADFRSFTLGLLNGALKRWPSLNEQVLQVVRDGDLDSPTWSLALYRVIDAEEYALAAARLLKLGKIGPQVLGQSYLALDYGSSKGAQEILSELLKLIGEGNKDAIRAGLSIARSFAYRKEVNPSLQEFGLAVFLAAAPERRSEESRDWVSLGKWLLPRFRKEVLEKVISSATDRNSALEDILTEGAKLDPILVLNAFRERLRAPGSVGVFLSRTFEPLVASLSTDDFRSWLGSLSEDELVDVAGHVPRPGWENGEVVVSPNTQVFWLFVDPNHPAFDRALREFRASTFNTGVFWGNGQDLFRVRIKVAEALIDDEIPSLAKWAEGFLKESRSLLEDAERQQLHDDAARDLGDA